MLSTHTANDDCDFDRTIQELSQPRDNSPQYVIAWQNQVRSGKGRGRDRYPRQEAEALAAELNAQYPHIKHWIVPA